MTDDAVAEHHIFCSPVDAQAVGVAAGLEAKCVVVDVDVGVGDEDVAGRARVAAVMH